MENLGLNLLLNTSKSKEEVQQKLDKIEQQYKLVDGFRDLALIKAEEKFGTAKPIGIKPKEKVISIKKPEKLSDLIGLDFTGIFNKEILK
jgi:hypothetical protein